MNDSYLILSAEGGRRRSRLDIFSVLARFCSALPLKKQQVWKDTGRNRHSRPSLQKSQRLPALQGRHRKPMTGPRGGKHRPTPNPTPHQCWFNVIVLDTPSSWVDQRPNFGDGRT